MSSGVSTMASRPSWPLSVPLETRRKYIPVGSPKTSLFLKVSSETLKAHLLNCVNYQALNTLLLLIPLLFVSNEVSAWSAKGHGVIALSAFEELDSKTQKHYQDILQHGPWEKFASKESSNKKQEPSVVLAANWPDWVRDKSLQVLFRKYGSGVVPGALKVYKYKTTYDWHFVNTLFLTQSGEVVDARAKFGNKGLSEKPLKCPPREGGRLFEVWPLLFTAYQEVTDKRDKAIVLAFILHFAGDAYQPLHLLSALDGKCRHDKGGNAFCVKPAIGLDLGFRKCKRRLHQVWDGGFGFFDTGRVHLTKKDGKLGFTKDVKDLSLALDKVRPVAGGVYPVKAGAPLQLSYQAQAIATVEHLSQASVGHLTAALLLLAK